MCVRLAASETQRAGRWAATAAAATRRHPPEKTCDTRHFGDAYRGAEGHRIVGALIYGCCSRIKLVSYSCTALSYGGRRHAPRLARDFFSRGGVAEAVYASPLRRRAH